MESYSEDNHNFENNENNENKTAKRGRPRKQINLSEFNSDSDLSNVKILRPRKQTNLSELTSESGSDLSNRRSLRPRKQTNLSELTSESGSDLSNRRSLRPRKQQSETKILKSKLNKTIETTKPKKLNTITKFTRSVTKLLANSSDDKSNDSNTTLIDTKFNNTTDDEIDNLSELINDDESNDENQVESNVRSSKRKQDFTNIKENLNKRKYSELSDQEIENSEFNQKKQKNDYFYVFIELQVTGLRNHEDIIKFCAYVDQSKKMAYYIFPKRKRLINKMSDLTKIWIGNQMMTDNELICDYEELLTVLSEFVKLIEEINKDKIILVFENPFQLQYLQYILLNNLRDLDLKERIENKLAGFIDCSKLFGDAGKFTLSEEVKNLNIKCNLPIQDPLYRLNLLVRLFYTKFQYVLKNQDNIIEDYETANEIAEHYFDYYIRKRNQLEDDEYSHLNTMDDILTEAKQITETKDSLTSDEIFGLYLIQKNKYQYINSLTYKPYTFCPRDRPRKKNEEPDQFKTAVKQSNWSNSMAGMITHLEDNQDDSLENDNQDDSLENDNLENSLISEVNLISDDDLISESNNSDSEFSIDTNMNTSMETV